MDFAIFLISTLVKQEMFGYMIVLFAKGELYAELKQHTVLPYFHVLFMSFYECVERPENSVEEPRQMRLGMR